jgi:Ca2+-binding RTX toxin-like protein
MKTIGSSPFGDDDTFLAANHFNPLGLVHTPVTPLDSFVGTPGDDNLTGTSGNDTFDLTAGGNDTASGLDGDDTFVMGATLNAGDHLDGGTGNDVVTLSGDYSAGLTLGATTIANVETLQLGAGYNYNITTNDANVTAGNTLTVDASQLSSHNSLVFNGSAETDGSFNVYGGAGDDTITTGAGPDYVDASAGGNDTINLGGDSNDPNQYGDFVYFGQAFTVNDSVNGGDPSNTSMNEVELMGNYRITLKATDLVNIGNLYLGSGSNIGQSYSYYIVENDGNLSSGQVMDVYGQSLTAGENLHFDGSAETDGSFLMYGGAGNDTLIGGAGDDYFKGGAGDDYIDGGAGKNRVTFSDDHNGVTVSLAIHVAQNTGDGMDTLHNIQDVSGGSGNDTLTGDINDNWLWGEGGSDTINGNGGDDIIQVGTLDGTLGTDVVDGGAGHDTIDFDDNGTMISGVTFSLALQGTAQVTGMDTVTATNFENVSGTSLDDVLTGDDNANVLYGSGGNDTLSGGAGNDTLYGDKVLVAADSNGGGDGPTDVQDYDPDVGGDDVLMGGAGNDILDGGEGNDTALYSDATSGVTVDLTKTGAQNVGGGDGHDTLISIENITGSAYADVLTGDDNANVLIGGGGSDTINGGGGDDTIDFTGTGTVAGYGDSGDDTINVVGSGLLQTAARFDGGDGYDVLNVTGDYSTQVVLSASTIINIEDLHFGAGFNYSIKTNDGTVAAGQNMQIDASDLGSGNSLDFNGSRELDGSFTILGGAGNDTLVGSVNADTFNGGLGADHMTTSGGADEFIYQSAAESTGLNHDIITGFDGSMDTFSLAQSVNAVDAAVTTGSLRGGAHFDADLAAAIGAGQLGAHDAVVFAPNAGNYAGHTYLIVDANGVAGYQAGEDYVIELSNATNLGVLNASSFSNHAS